jgi:Tfp pilus assembly protein PilN
LQLGLSGNGRQSDAGFDLLPSAQGRGSGKLWRRSVAVLMVMLLLLGATALYLPLHYKRVDLSALEGRVADARSEAQGVADLKRKAEALLARDQTLEQILRKRVTATELLEEVS